MLNHNVYERTFGNRAVVIPVAFMVGLALLGVVAERLDRDVRAIEVSHFVVRLQELQSIVTLMNASNAAKDREVSMNRFIGSNPMEWFDPSKSAVNYLGERSLDDLDDVRGKWIFDREIEVLAYRPKTMSKTELIQALSSQGSDLNELESLQLLPKKPSDWLRFKVVGLLSKEDKSTHSGRIERLALAWVE